MIMMVVGKKLLLNLMVTFFILLVLLHDNSENVARVVWNNIKLVLTDDQWSA